VQAYARHGSAFFERLFLHDMYDRAFVQVHDTNAGDDVSIGYYAWQLGYGLFPWSAFALLGIVAALGGVFARGSRAPAFVWLSAWFLTGFALFAAALTKYHHYVLPAVAPAALLAGITIARPLFGADEPADSGRGALGSALLGLSGLFSACLVALIGRDLVQVGRVEGQARLLHLFTYNYARAWPESLDFRAWFWVTAALAATLAGLWLVPRLRRIASAAFVAMSVAFSGFVVHGYLPKAAPHWGQRELVLEYYRRRASPKEPLIAYQMNWKGENFYSGNRVSAFVTSGEPLRSYLRELERRGTRVVFVMAEHQRRSLLEAELDPGVRVRPLTGRELNNKFFVARLEL
jgi:4-amino-4-deoxy-L-arabinose transferase-like glycosyltransferase